jgi:Na+-driven multidrug efflux pump
MSDIFMIAIFIGLVTVCGVGFAQGYMMGIMKGRDEVIDAMREYTEKQERRAKL